MKSLQCFMIFMTPEFEGLFKRELQSREYEIRGPNSKFGNNWVSIYDCIQNKRIDAICHRVLFQKSGRFRTLAWKPCSLTKQQCYLSYHLNKYKADRQVSGHCGQTNNRVEDVLHCANHNRDYANTFTYHSPGWITRIDRSVDWNNFLWSCYHLATWKWSIFTFKTFKDSPWWYRNWNYPDFSCLKL